MGRHEVTPHGVRHQRGGLHQIPDRRSAHVEPETRRIGHRVEGSPITDIVGDRTITLYFHLMVKGERKGAHALESNPSDDAIRHLDENVDRTARTLDDDLGLRFDLGNQLTVHRVPSQGDRGVPAHRRVPLVVHEQHRQVGLGQVGLDRDDPVHVEVAPRLVHERAAEMIEVLAHVAALVQDGVSEYRWVTGLHDTDRLTPGVHLGGGDRQPAACCHAPACYPPNRIITPAG